MAGLAKLQNIEMVHQYFSSLHIHSPLMAAYTVASFETVCGFLLFFGLASRIAAIPLIFIMLVALSTAHAPDLSDFRFLFDPILLVKQTPYPFLITSLIVFIFGPGKISLDGWIKRWVEKQPKY
jgi:putative oxidoreductase